ncbi:MAG TPA: cyclase family protein [Bryobacteraceae bacterium]|nr:cyclase family protein [Bryobacteraceae bacterium]
MPSPWIDVTRPVYQGMPNWPGDPEPVIEQFAAIGDESFCNTSKVSMCVHTGTHMDAPLHFIDGAAPMDALPLDAVIGVARVVQINDPVAVRAAELPADLAEGERILFKTRNSAGLWAKPGFQRDFVYISQEAALALAQSKVRTVGIDYLSIGGFHSDMQETHLALLGAGIWVIEGLDLSQVEPVCYEMICLPLRLAGVEGSPARVALRRL